MEFVVSALVGIGLAASCGFRVFVPMLVASAAAKAGYLQLARGFDWLDTWTAFVAFAVAATVEIVAYCIPWVDNLLDTITSPIAILAGTIVFAASGVDMDPFLQWSLAIIAGGGSAAIVQVGTVITRGTSTTTTGGLANIGFSILESLAGVIFSVMSIVVPLLTVVLLLALVGWLYYVGRPALRMLFWGKRKKG
jgi:hypothetical protein